MHGLGHLLLETWDLFFQFAPYLLLGFLVSGALYVYLPKERLIRHLGRPGLSSVFKAALFGIPLPLCSCGVIPAALSLRKQGATRGATVAFLISTPQTGADSIIATYSLMGGFIAVMRPLFATLTAVATGIAINLSAPESAHDPDCHDHDHVADPPLLFQTSGRFRKIFSYGLRDHLGGVYRWLLVGLVLAALVSVLLPQHIPLHRLAKHSDEAVTELPFHVLGFAAADLVVPAPASPCGVWFREFLIEHNELLCMLLMVLAGIPLYICATGSIPIAMSFMQAGLSPGAAFVFLMTGPATNVTTVVMAWRYLGRRPTFIYLAGIIGVGLLSGYAINQLAPYHGFLSEPAPTLCHEHGIAATAFGWVCALVMAGAIGAVAWIDARMAWRARFGGPATSKALTVAVDGMTCGHCKATVEGALRTLPGILHAEANVSANRVELVLGKRAPSMAQIRDVIEGAGYQVPGAAPPLTPH